MHPKELVGVHHLHPLPIYGNRCLGALPAPEFHHKLLSSLDVELKVVPTPDPTKFWISSLYSSLLLSVIHPTMEDSSENVCRWHVEEL